MDKSDLKHPPGPVKPRLLGRSPSKRTLWLIVAGALVVRAAFVFVHPLYFRDSERYIALAENLRHGHGYSASYGPPYQPEMQRTPLYPSLLALLFSLSGRSEPAARAANAALGALICFLVYRLTRRLSDESTALVAAGLSAFYPVTIYYTSYVGMEVFLAFLLVATTSVFSRAFEEDRLRLFALSGALVGLINLARPFMLFFPLFFLGAIVLEHRKLRPAGVRFAAFLVPLLLVAGPWTVRNVLLFGSPCLIGHGVGGLLDAATREAEAGSVAAANLAHNDDPDFRQFMLSDSHARMSEANERLIAKSLDRLRANLGPFLLNIPKRIPRLWITSYHPGVPGPLLIGIRIGGAAVLLLGLYGLWTRRGELGRFVPLLLFPVYITVMGAPLNTTARYTVPVRDLYLILCAVALTAIARSGRGRKLFFRGPLDRVCPERSFRGAAEESPGPQGHAAQTGRSGDPSSRSSSG